VADLEYSVEEGIGTLTLNRPAKKNAFTMDMIEEWAGILVEARTDPEVRVIVLTGAGDAFCSGVDLGRFDHGEPTPLERKTTLSEHIHRIAYALEDLDKPVIAAVNGPAVGAGMDMALMCDIRFASRTARFSEGYIKVGLVPGDGGCYYLPRLVGVSKALELCWSGDFVDADEAHRLGIVNQVYEEAELAERTRAFARRIASAPQLNVRTIKRAMYQSARCDLRTALDLISSHMAVVQSTHDSREAMAAFREKREPEFKGR
jgi:enoyl-CoA hydratase/carnithine racemase